MNSKVTLNRPPEVRTVANLLIKFSVFDAVKLVCGNPIYAFLIMANIILANGLLRMRSWARICTIIRSLFGIILTPITIIFGASAKLPEYITTLNFILSVLDIVCFVSIITLLTIAQVRNANWN